MLQKKKKKRNLASPKKKKNQFNAQVVRKRPKWAE